MSKYFFGKKRYTREKTVFFEFFARKTVNYYLFLKRLLLGIPFLITNYFCGNKSVFAVLNDPLVRLVQFRSFALQKPFRQAAISFPQKRFAPKRAYFQMIF